MAAPAKQSAGGKRTASDIALAAGAGAAATAAAGYLAYTKMDLSTDWLHSDAAHALGLSTLAGLSTSIGALVAVVRKPDDAMLAFLLGLALGVMLTLSVVEMWVRNAMEHGWPLITVFMALGVALYYFLQPYFPEFNLEEQDDDDTRGTELQPAVSTATNTSTRADASKKRSPHRTSISGDQPDTSSPVAAHASPSAAAGQGAGLLDAQNSGRMSVPPSELFRLGLLMAFTMTLHNLPEGLAVAFSSLSAKGFGEVMAIAIAMHNIPEGIIVAAPIYAATGNRWQALGVATASGLSEPLGALAAVLFVKTFLTETRLQCALAMTGGIMLAVCILELWPEARKCKRDIWAWQGIAVGAVLMVVTLAADV